jgi:4-amino-4-deoxy-L-arabinose transferase-like glycosyltransferase
MENSEIKKQGDGRSELFFLAVLLLTTAALLLINIWNTREFHCDDEYLYIKIAKEMFQSRELWLPIWLQEPALYKPPFIYWLMMSFFAFFGPGLVVARLSVAATALLTVFIVYQLGKKLYGVKPAFVAGLLTATSFGFIIYGKTGMLDLPMMCFFALAIYFFYRAFSEKSVLFAFLFWSTAGASALVKGPVSSIILFLIAAFFLTCYRGWKTFLKPGALAGMGLGLLFSALWPLAMYLTGRFKLWYDFFVVRENIGKFADIHYTVMEFLPYYLQHIFPWSLLFLAALVLVFFRKRFLEPGYALPLLWLLCTVLVFLLPATKLKHYLIPAVPVAALLIAGLWKEAREHKIFRIGMSLTAVIFIVIAVVIPLLMRLSSSLTPFLLLLAAFTVLVFLIVFLFRTSLPQALLSYAVLIFFLTLAGPYFTYDLFPQGAIDRLSGTQIPLGVVKTQIYSFSYFINRRAIQLQTADEMQKILKEGGNVIISATNLDNFRKDVPDLALSLAERYSWEKWKERLSTQEILKALMTANPSLLKEKVYLFGEKQ